MLVLILKIIRWLTISVVILVLGHYVSVKGKSLSNYALELFNAPTSQQIVQKAESIAQDTWQWARSFFRGQKK